MLVRYTIKNDSLKMKKYIIMIYNILERNVKMFQTVLWKKEKSFDLHKIHSLFWKSSPVEKYL